MLQVVMHAQIAEEEGAFTLDDVICGIRDKMIRRHPHVFSGVTYASHEEQLRAWDAIKKEEKRGREWHGDYLPAAFQEADELIQRARIRKGYAE